MQTRWPRIPAALALVLVVLGTSGCLFDYLSWSPDGRYLAYFHPGTETTWVYDTETANHAPVGWRDSLISPRFSPDGRALYAVQSTDMPTTLLLLDRGDTSATLRGRIPGFVPPMREMPGSGRILYLRWNESLRKQEAVEAWPDGSDPRVLFESTRDIFIPAASPDSRQVACVANDMVLLWDRDSNTTRSLLQRDDTLFLWPEFLNNNELLLLAASKNQKMHSGSLVRFNLDQGSSETLCQGVFSPAPFSLHPDGRHLALSVMLPIAAPELARKMGYAVQLDYRDGEHPTGWQIMLVDAYTGEKTLLTRDRMGMNLMPAWSPSGDRLAFLQGDKNHTLLRILNINDPARDVVDGQDDAGREIAYGERARQSGNPGLAMQHYESVRQMEDAPQFWRDMANFRSMELTMLADEANLSRARAYLSRINNAPIRQQAEHWLYLLENPE